MTPWEILGLVLGLAVAGAFVGWAVVLSIPVDWLLPKPHRLPKAPPETPRRNPDLWGASFAQDRERLRQTLRQASERQEKNQRDMDQMREKIQRDIERRREKVARDQAILRERMEKDRARMRSGQRTGRPFPHDPVTIFQSAMADFVREANAEAYEPPPVTKPALSPAELELKEAFRIVGLSETATEEQIRAHRKSQLGHFHPDKHPEGKERRRAEQMFIAYNAGFQTIFKHKGWA